MSSFRFPIIVASLLGLMPVVRAGELTLQRFAPITVYKGFSDDLKNGEDYVFMDVEDTCLLKAQPDLNFGGAPNLVLADPADAILIAFKQLNRAITVGSEVTGVELRLHPSGSEPGNVADVTIELYRVTMPWRDGCSNGAKQTYAATYVDRFTGTGVHRRPWTKPGGAADRAARPSFSGKLADCWDAQAGVFVIKGPGLAADVNYWLSRHYRNYGWMITLKGDRKPSHQVAFVSSDATWDGDPSKSPRPALHVTFSEKPVVKPDLPDLDVTYIERTPRYTRYHDNGETSYERKLFRGDDVGIMKKPDYADEQKWPKDGDAVTFTAHVKNAGTQLLRGPVAYRWLLNDQVVGEGRFEGELAPWREWTATYEWKWAVDHTDHRNLLLQFEVDPTDQVTEITKNNNLVEKYIGAKTLKYWVERGAYDYVKDFPCAYGSYSFEDYLQWHFSVWNDTYFDKSRFDGVAPDGCLERTTLDDFGIVENDVLGGGIHRPHDKWDPHFDGEWGSEWDVGVGSKPAAIEKGVDDILADAKKAGKELTRDAALAEYQKRVARQEESARSFLRTRRVVLEGSLLHEASHQTIGAYDIYWSNIEASTPTEPRGKCKLKDETGFYVTRGSWYAYAGLMGGSDTRPNPSYWYGTGLYGLNTVGGVNTDLRFRNGFYGDWQYDLPRACYLKLTSMDGTPLAKAAISVWQTHSNTIDDQSLVAKDVPVGADGTVLLPYQDSLEDADNTTITQHTFLKKNHWGRPDVVGENITLLVQVNAYGQRDYQFVRVIDFNNFYWMGQHDQAELPLKCRISPSERMDLKTNVALHAKVSAYGGQEQTARLVDGDVTTFWEGGAAKPGDRIVIELPTEKRIGVVQIVQDGGYGAFFQRFRITVAASGVPETFDEAQRRSTGLFAEQGPEPFSLTMANDKDANNQRPSEMWVTYAATPRPGKMICIEALDGGATHVSEIRVFAEK